MTVDSALPPCAAAATLDALTAAEFDLLVIGGGITGAGIARDAAMRGMAVALIEADDFAAGTSSRSTKLIHGGLRYLAMGDVALVRESALERKAVHALAPHLAEPARMVVPARSRLELMKFAAGITVYEKLGAVVERDLHENWDAGDLAREEPALDRTLHPRACVYREYLTDDARLVLAVLRGARRAGAVLASRVAATGLLLEGGRVCGVQARCTATDTDLAIRARAVVNAAGPWAEAVSRLESPQPPAHLHLSKGIHVVVPRTALDVRNMLFMRTRDDRNIFAIPRGEVVYIGTTDTSWSGADPLWPEIERDEVAYLLEPLGRYFTTPPPTPDDVIAAWAGLRPLVSQPGKAPKEMSRKEEIWIGEKGLITIAGGKLTGFRKMAEEVMDAVAGQLDRTLPPPPPLEPLPGGDFDGDLEQLASGLVGTDNLGDGCARRLARLYGTEASSVIARGAEPLSPGSDLLLGEIDWALDVEAARDLEDVMYRRLRAAWFRPQQCLDGLEAAATRMAERLGWSEAERSAQIEQVRARLDQELAFRR